MREEGVWGAPSPPAWNWKTFLTEDPRSCFSENMADDIFGDPNLFAEFERPREPSDRILMKAIDAENTQDEDDTGFDHLNEEDAPKNNHVRFELSSEEDEGENEENMDSENDSDAENVPVHATASEGFIVSPDKSPKAKIKAETVESTVGDNRSNLHLVIKELNEQVASLKKESILLMFCKASVNLR